MSISSYDYQQMCARTAKKIGIMAQPIGYPIGLPAEKESELHEQIRQDCVALGWLALTGSMAHRTYRTIGEADFLILGPSGGFLMIECKAKNRKRSPAQLAFAAHARKLGHTVDLVNSVEEWRIVRDCCELAAGIKPT